MRKQKIKFFDISLYKKIEEQIWEELCDYFFIFNNSEKIKNILILNSENNFLEKELNLYFENNKNNSEKIKINYFNFGEYSKNDFEYFGESEKNNLIIGINSFHNVNNLKEYISAVKNNLKNGGIFCGNFFGTENLSQLKNIILKNDAEFSKKIYPRFNAVIGAESVYGILQSVGLKNITIFPEKINYEFNSFKDAADFLKNINERNYLINSQKTAPSRKIFTENLNGKIVLDFEIIKFYCTR